MSSINVLPTFQTHFVASQFQEAESKWNFLPATLALNFALAKMMELVFSLRMHLVFTDSWFGRVGRNLQKTRTDDEDES